MTTLNLNVPYKHRSDMPSVQDYCQERLAVIYKAIPHIRHTDAASLLVAEGVGSSIAAQETTTFRRRKGIIK